MKPHACPGVRLSWGGALPVPAPLALLTRGVEELGNPGGTAGVSLGLGLYQQLLCLRCVPRGRQAASVFTCSLSFKTLKVPAAQVPRAVHAGDRCMHPRKACRPSTLGAPGSLLHHNRQPCVWRAYWGILLPAEEDWRVGRHQGPGPVNTKLQKTAVKKITITEAETSSSIWAVCLHSLYD